MISLQKAVFQYNRANQRFKLRQFFLFAAAGVWAYSLIDSYVGANLYNATAKADQLIDEMKQIEELGVQLKITPTQFQLGIVKILLRSLVSTPWLMEEVQPC